MVQGIEKFREYFKDYYKQYVLIGVLPAISFSKRMQVDFG